MSNHEYSHEAQEGMKMVNRVAENLRLMRERRGMTQSALANEAGLTSAAVNYVEKGHRNPNPDTLEKLARTLRCKVDDFFERREDFDSLLRLNRILTDDVIRAREEGDEKRLDEYLYPELERVTKLLNRFGPFTEAPASKRRRARKRAQEAPVDEGQAEVG
jgi:transcriptional regulator with XRE-family HTH domain